MSDDQYEELVERLERIEHRMTSVRDFITMSRSDAMAATFGLLTAIENPGENPQLVEGWRQVRNHLVIQLNTGLEPK